VLRPACLHASLFNAPDGGSSYPSRRTLLFRDRRRRDISPNWEKYARNWSSKKPCGIRPR
jgi:hypothetical protein